MSIEYGGMAEWFKAAVLKTVELKGSVGSNPTSSAIRNLAGPEWGLLLYSRRFVSRIRTDEVEFR